MQRKTIASGKVLSGAKKKNSAKSYRTSDFIGCPNNCTEWLWGKKGRDSKTKTLAKQVWLEGSWTI